MEKPTDNDYFESFLELIPQKIYYPPKPPDDAWKLRGTKKKKSKKEISEKERQRKIKLFDPANSKTVPQLQRESFEAESKKEKKTPAAAPETKKLYQRKDESILDIRKRYHEKLASFRKRREASNPEFPLSERRQRSSTNVGAKRKRDDVSAPEETSEASEKPEKKSKKSKQPSKQLETSGGTDLESPAEERRVKRSKKTQKDDEKNADFMFGTLAPITSKLSSTKKPKKKNNELLLSKLESKKKKLAELPAESAEKVKIHDSMQTALKRARGEKVIDDVARLKKTLKKKEKKKEKSAKEWKERIKAQKDTQQSAADKRRDNIAEYVADKKKNNKKTKKRPAE